MDLPTTIKAAAAVVGSIGAIGTAAYAVDTRYAPMGEYVTVSDFQKVNTRILINAFWDRMDDLQESRQNGNTNREHDIHEELTEILAEICEVKPTFRYCSTGIP